MRRTTMSALRLITRTFPFLRRHRVVQWFIALFPRARIQTIYFNRTCRLIADVADPNPRDYFLKESFEPELFAIARPFLANGGICFDVGASWGFCSFGLVDEVDRPVEFHLFEANPDIFRWLQKSRELHPAKSIHLLNCCVTSKPGVSRLKLSTADLGGSFVSSEGEREVPNLTLDDYLAARKIERVDFMKMDIEGHEPFALAGARQALQRGVFACVYFEVAPVTLARQGFTTQNLLAAFREAGFKLFWCKPTDLQSPAIAAGSFDLNVNGSVLRLAPLGEYLPDLQTDLLAIHNQSNLLPPG